MGSLEKLLELKLSRWSLLSSFCPSLAWPLPRALLFPELSVVLATYRPSRHGSWPSSSTLLTHSHSWLDTEEAGGLFLSQEHLRSSPWRATHRPRLSGTGPNKLTRP